MSTMTEVRLQRTIAAPPARVYRAWLDPDLLRRWLAPGSMSVKRAEGEERVGGTYRIWQADEHGEDVGGFEWELLELVPDSGSSSCGASSAPTAWPTTPSTRA
jgi:uncharacterized protein YndB with AHSA1/START domain